MPCKVEMMWFLRHQQPYVSELLPHRTELGDQSRKKVFFPLSLALFFSGRIRDRLKVTQRVNIWRSGNKKKHRENILAFPDGFIFVILFLFCSFADIEVIVADLPGRKVVVDDGLDDGGPVARDEGLAHRAQVRRGVQGNADLKYKDISFVTLLHILGSTP